LEDNFQNFCIMTLRDKASPWLIDR
jgi:hypothetical protein